LGVQIYEEEQFKCALFRNGRRNVEIPKEILNAIDSFNVESNEEFLQFE
jgi:hypothetical protein